MEMPAVNREGPAFPLIRLLLGSFGLLVLKEILVHIPVLQEMTAPWLLLTPVEWVAILVRTAVLGLLLITTRDMTTALRAALPNLPVVARLAQLFILVVAFGWAYSIYLPLAAVLLKQALYLYQAVMLVAVVASGVGFVVVFFQGLNGLSAAFLGWLRSTLDLGKTNG